jgi:endonuclease/exonuclease/phosphatase family metal-dependent hydrolase/endonuclease YncB( thermonuclease family)
LIKKIIYIIISFLFVSCLSCTTTGQQKFLQTVTVVKVISFNQAIVKGEYGEYRIKLIGVNIPSKKVLEWKASELGLDSDSKKNISQEYKIAKNYFKKNISSGDVISIEPGFKKTDKYGNRLVFLYMPDHSMLNETIISSGWSSPKVVPDNRKYYKKFVFLFNKSIENKKGFWKIWDWIKFNKYLAATSGKNNGLKIKETPSFLTSKENKFNISNKKRISIMTFNVENLFDTEHDPGKDDYAYLPLSKKNTKEHKSICRNEKRGKRNCFEMDWSESVLKEKMKRLAGTILSANKGNGADIIILQEVENFSVLDRLRREYLAKRGYSTIVLIEGDDFRGIDVAFLSKLPLYGKPKLHKIPFSERASSRGILQAVFILPDGKKLYTLGLHFPSQSNPVKFRIEAFQHLNKIRSSLPDDAIVVAGGDCNVTSTEDKEKNLFNRHTINWLVSHKIGKMKYKGSTYYPRIKTWSFFDILLFSRNLSPAGKASWKVVPESIKISNSYSYQVNREGTPMRYKSPSYKGVSDHWPVIAGIEYRK